MKSTDISVKLWKLTDTVAIYDVYICGEKIGMGVYDMKANNLDLDNAVEFRASVYRPYVARLITQDLRDHLQKQN